MKVSKFNLVLLSSIILTSISGCGSKAKTLNVFEIPSDGFNTSEDVNVVFYHTMNQDLQKVLELYIEEFEEIYPNITIDHHAIGGYDDVRDQIKTSISSGKNECDIAYCYPDHLANYRKANSIVALDNLVDSTVSVTGGEEIFGFTSAQKEDFIKAYYNEGYSLNDGHMFCLPLAKSTEVMYYNKTFFEEHEINVPKTWDELWDVCRKIKSIDQISTPLGYDSSSNLFITLTEQYQSGYTTYDDDHLAFDNDTNKKIVSDLKAKYDEGLFTLKSLYGSYTSGLFVETRENKQKSYMSIGSSAGASNQIPTDRAFEVGIASIPQYDASNPKVVSQGPDVCIFDNNDEQKIMASWLFIKFLTTSVQFQSQFSMTSGYTPVIKSVNDYDIYKEWLASKDGYSNLAALSTNQCVNQANMYFTSPVFAGSATVRDEVGLLIDAAVSGSKTVDEAFINAITMCNADM